MAVINVSPVQSLNISNQYLYFIILHVYENDRFSFTYEPSRLREEKKSTFNIDTCITFFLASAHAHAHTRMRARAHARTRTHEHTHTHTLTQHSKSCQQSTMPNRERINNSIPGVAWHIAVIAAYARSIFSVFVVFVSV